MPAGGKVGKRCRRVQRFARGSVPVSLRQRCGVRIPCSSAGGPPARRPGRRSCGWDGESVAAFEAVLGRLPCCAWCGKVPGHTERRTRCWSGVCRCGSPLRPESWPAWTCPSPEPRGPVQQNGAMSGIWRILLRAQPGCRPIAVATPSKYSDSSQRRASSRALSLLALLE